MSDIMNLFQTYDLKEIIAFIVILALAIKEFVTFWGWAKDKLRNVFNKENQEKETDKEIKREIDENAHQITELVKNQELFEKNMQEMKTMVKALIASDKDDIKAWITEKHHYFCYEKRQIDDYSLDCLEKRYTHYVEEGGNSFIHDLMEDIRALPKTSDGTHQI